MIVGKKKKMGSVSLSKAVMMMRSEGELVDTALAAAAPSMLQFTRKKKKKRAAVAVAMATPKFKGTQMREQQLNEMIERKVKEATEVCDGNQSSDECKVAWDEVEEISQAKADFRLRLEKQDPLESFCQTNPDTDECRIYDH